MPHEFWFGHSVERRSDTQLNKLQVKIGSVKWKVSVNFKVELSDESGFADAS